LYGKKQTVVDTTDSITIRVMDGETRENEECHSQISLMNTDF